METKPKQLSAKYLKNRERNLEQSRKYYEEHKDAVKKKNLDYYYKNRDRANEKNKQRYHRHKNWSKDKFNAELDKFFADQEKIKNYFAEHEKEKASLILNFM